MSDTRFELVIFDCDGVLVDSEPIANRIFTRALNDLGLAVDYEQVCRDFIGLSMEKCIGMIETRLGSSVPPSFVDDLRRKTFDEFRRSLRPVAGVVEALDGIEARICVASSGEIEKMRLTLGLTGLLPRFEGRMFSATEVARGKPAPDLFLHAARRMSADPRASAVVEDSLPGVRAARAAGMRVFGYAARSDDAALAAEGATVFRDMAFLPGLLES